MPRAGLEPARLAAQAPKTCVAASYTTSALCRNLIKNAERSLAATRQGSAGRGALRYRVAAKQFLYFLVSFSHAIFYPQFFAIAPENPAMHFESPPSSSAYPGDVPWYKLLTRYHWFVLAVCALGWLFDCLDQQLFNLARTPAMKDLVKGSP